MAELVDTRYALSLFQAGLELEKIEDFHKEVNFINQLLVDQEKLFEILKHPRINRDEKKSIVNNIFEDRLSQEILNFLYIVIDRKREKYLHGIIGEFNKKYNEYMNIVNVLAVTAIPMVDDAKDRLTKALEEKLNKKIRLENQVDKSIIGGVMLRLDNKFIDSTLSSQLRSMETALKGVSL